MSIDDAKCDAAGAAQARRLGIPEWQLEMDRGVDPAPLAPQAVGTDVIRDIVADSRRTYAWHHRLVLSANSQRGEALANIDMGTKFTKRSQFLIVV